jgi:uncharacterized linocin/CFP29 family protein
MSQNNPQVPWTDEQWARVEKVIQEEANRARVAASFLPLYGPLPGNADYVSKDTMSYPEIDAGPARKMMVADTTTIPLATLQVRVYVRGAQMADPDLSSALQMFRRGANVLARLEDAVVFRGLKEVAPESYDVDGDVEALHDIYQILGGKACRGLLPPENDPLRSDKSEKEKSGWIEVPAVDAEKLGPDLVTAVSEAVGDLEGDGQFGPFAVVLGQGLFTAVQTPNDKSLVLPQDRIIPFLGGGPLLRSSLLPGAEGIVVALGGAPVELVVATDVSLNFLQVAPDPAFVFRIYEKITLRIKQARAIVGLRKKK